MDKNIVFDFDETIGYFDQIIELIKYTKKTSKQEIFNFLKTFPYVFRTSIFDIFCYIVRLKKEKKIKNVILYSNNNNDVFIGIVLSFIHEKLNYNLFDVSLAPLAENIFNNSNITNKKLLDLFNNIIFNSIIYDFYYICIDILDIHKYKNNLINKYNNISEKISFIRNFVENFFKYYLLLILINQKKDVNEYVNGYKNNFKNFTFFKHIFLFTKYPSINT
jgi:hypothetical protein